MNLGRRLFTAFLALLLGAGLIYLAIPKSTIASINPSNSSTGEINVVSTLNSWGSIAKLIGGDKVKVTSLINNMNIDPHSYEATALDSLRILHSDVFVENGLGYDSFADRILSTQKYNGRIIKVSDYLKNSSNINPHLWFNYPVVLDFAIDLTKLYANLLPSQTNYFNVQLSKFELGMKEIDRNISKISKADNNQSVAYTERVPGYIIAAAGLKNLTPVGFSNSVENGDNVAPADYLAMKELILNKEIKILFYNEQTISAITSEVKSLAVNSGISIFGITETMPNSFPNYLIWNQFLWNQLQKDLGN